MRILTVLVAVLAVGCSSGAPKALDELADRACACPRDDEACGKKVLAELDTYTSANKLSAVSRHVTDTGIRINECLASAGVRQQEVVAVMGKLIK